MWLKSLHVENFRGFEKLDVTFDEHVTLLVGGNGAGKTGVLEAIKVAFGSFFSAIEQSPDQGIDRNHARRVFRPAGESGTPGTLEPQWPVVVGASVGGTRHPIQGSILDDLSWERSRGGEEQYTARRGDTGIRDYASALQHEVQRGVHLKLPLIAYYGTKRLWRQKKLTKRRRGLGTRFDGYQDCLDIASSHTLLDEWMYHKTYAELQRRTVDAGYRDPQLAAVANAVAACIDGVSDFRYDVNLAELCVQRGGRLETFAMLSDGYRNMIAMVADIAERAAVLNSWLEGNAARETPGIVLVDEMELHLHPKWQRAVIPSLRRAFPLMQVIATTHSPQVLASVARDQVRLFDDNRLVNDSVFVEGRSSNELLEDVFGVPARPPATKAALDELFGLIDLGDYPSARSKLRTLEARLGRDDGDIVRARWILESEAGVTPAPPIAS